MNNTKFKTALENLLKTDERLIDEQKELNLSIIKELANKTDEKLIELLLSNAETKSKFFLQLKNALVFKQNDFKFFLDENRIDNSYTAYENKIGLSSNNRLLKDSGDVVLNFPYKDCVLEGGQSTEEGMDEYFEFDETNAAYELHKAQRKEIFFNEIIAKDEIDRLEEPKAFTNIKRYTAKGEEKLKAFTRDTNGTITDNLIIKGNNLLALHSLKEEFGGKIKLIYIDPPYNKGGKGDTFIYNNNFKRSSWLTFIKNRLEVSKELLTDDGVLIVAIDKNEQIYLGVLLDELFKNHEKHCVTIVHNPRGVQGTNFSYTHEYAFFVLPINKKSVSDRVIQENEIEWSNLRNWGSESERSDAKNCFYPIIVDEKTSEILEFGDVCEDNFHPKSRAIIKNGRVTIYPIDGKGIERKWRYAKQSVEEIKHLLRARIKSNEWDIELGKDFGQYKTVWIDPRYDSNDYGTNIVKELVPDCKFSFPKSLWNVYDCLHTIISKDKEAIVLDFHAGSGTTAHAVLELNKDGGNRKFILVEQMDYVEDVTAKRVHQVIKNNKDGSFIYLEIKKCNQEAKEKIVACKSLKELEKLLNELSEKYFLHYNVKLAAFKDKIIKEENFKKLPLQKQQEMFCKMLDLNQLYVNASEMEDKKFGLTKEDIVLTKNFYNL
jgi:adenine-specific DNA-methyltransferase